jgi:hypothetical protein
VCGLSRARVGSSSAACESQGLVHGSFEVPEVHWRPRCSGRHRLLVLDLARLRLFLFSSSRRAGNASRGGLPLDGRGWGRPRLSHLVDCAVLAHAAKIRAVRARRSWRTAGGRGRVAWHTTRRTSRQRVSAPLEPVDDPFVILAQLCDRSAAVCGGRVTEWGLLSVFSIRLVLAFFLSFSSDTRRSRRSAAGPSTQRPSCRLTLAAGLVEEGRMVTARTPRTITTDATT